MRKVSSLLYVLESYFYFFSHTYERNPVASIYSLILDQYGRNQIEDFFVPSSILDRVPDDIMPIVSNVEFSEETSLFPRTLSALLGILTPRIIVRFSARRNTENHMFLFVRRTEVSDSLKFQSQQSNTACSRNVVTLRTKGYSCTPCGSRRDGRAKEKKTDKETRT